MGWSSRRRLLKGFFTKDLQGVLGSSSKARKTWILMDVAISVATGQPFWGRRTIAGRVLYINFEIPNAFAKSRFSTIMEKKVCPPAPTWTSGTFVASPPPHRPRSRNDPPR
jgi:RecA-family ATPase